MYTLTRLTRHLDKDQVEGYGLYIADMCNSCLHKSHWNQLAPYLYVICNIIIQTEIHTVMYPLSSAQTCNIYHVIFYITSHFLGFLTRAFFLRHFIAIIVIFIQSFVVIMSETLCLVNGSILLAYNNLKKDCF